MKRLLVLTLLLALALTAACAETRERVIAVEGQEETVTETLCRTDLGFSFWYDAEWLTTDYALYEDGKSVLLELRTPEGSSGIISLELMPPEVVGMLPWEFLEQNAPDGAEQYFEILDSGAELSWYAGTGTYNPSMMIGCYVLVDGERWIAAYGYWPTEAADGCVPRFAELMRTVTFGDAAGAPAAPETPAAALPVRAAWAESAADTGTAYLSWNLMNSDAWVLFTAEEEVTDFRILELIMQFGEGGEYSFRETEAFALDTLWPAQPLIAGLEFPGDMPCWGISYVDAAGHPHRCTVEISGENGDIILTEY